MPRYAVRDNAEGCGPDEPFGVVDTEPEDGDEALVSCHASQDEARAEAERLEGEAGGEQPAGEASIRDPGRFEAVLAIEGERSRDGRYIEPGALTWRVPPLPLMLSAETTMGHDGARFAGVVEELWREGSEIRGRGRYDQGEAGQELRRLVNAQALRWVSADLAAGDEDVEIREEGECGMEDLFLGGDSDCTITVAFVSGEIMGATACAFPAFAECVIVPEGSTIPEATEAGREAATALPDAVAASGRAVANVPERPPAEWFDNPQLGPETEEGSVFVLDSGRVYGRLALWGTCHISYRDACVDPPQSRSNYAYAHTGEITTSDGTRLPVGRITLSPREALDLGHADLRLDARQAAAHYDNVCTAVAAVRYGEDEHGIYYAGALLPEATEDQVNRLRASGGVSGDWRRIGGSMELVAALAVNVGGFPVPRSVAAAATPCERPRARARVLGGTQVSLVSAGFVPNDPLGQRLAEVFERLDVLDRFSKHLVPLVRERMLSELQP